jgi:hypothetical protein
VNKKLRPTKTSQHNSAPRQDPFRITSQTVKRCMQTIFEHVCQKREERPFPCAPSIFTRNRENVFPPCLRNNTNYILYTRLTRLNRSSSYRIKFGRTRITIVVLYADRIRCTIIEYVSHVVASEIVSFTYCTRALALHIAMQRCTDLLSFKTHLVTCIILTRGMMLFQVSKEEYDMCRITNPNPRIIAYCDKPYKLMYVTITFRSFTPQPGGLEFQPGQDYYFICKYPFIHLYMCTCSYVYILSYYAYI